MGNITPFTYQDGSTYLEILRHLENYVRGTLVPNVNSSFGKFLETITDELDTLESELAADRAEIRDGMARVQGLLDDFIRKIEDYIRQHADPIIRAEVERYIADLWDNLLGKENAARKQGELYGKFFTKLRNGESVSICALGDSTTYGYDMVSGDRVPAPAGTLPDGSVHRVDRSPRPYPTVLQSRLTEMYGANKVSVINRGYSGDTTKTSFNRWISPHGAGLTLLSLGINDANHAGTSFTIADHLEYFEKIILREINEYDSAVVIVMPIKQHYHNPSKTIDVYRVAVVSLATKYGIPVVDAEPWLSGFGDAVYSDGTHPNTKGYEVMGTRLASLFVGDGPLVPFKVSGGTRIATRPTVDNMLLGPDGLAHAMAQFSGGGSIQDGGTNGRTHISALMKDKGSIYYAFYAETTDLIVNLSYGIFAGNTIKMELDFGIEQPTHVSRAMVDMDVWTRETSPASVLLTSDRDEHVTKLDHYSKVLHVASPGWHTIKITGTGNFPTTYEGVRVYNLEFLSYRDYRNTLKQGSYRLPVPRYYNTETEDITSFRIPWRDLMSVLGLVDWEADIYKAPALKVSLRTWDQGLTEYILVVNPGRYAHSERWPTIQHFSFLRKIDLTGTPNPTNLRELENVTFDTDKWELNFTLKTEGKNIKKNFVVDIQVF